jgi:hypothetical protein
VGLWGLVIQMTLLIPFKASKGKDCGQQSPHSKDKGNGFIAPPQHAKARE